MRCSYDYLTSNERLPQESHAKVTRTVARQNDTSYVSRTVAVRFAAFLQQPCDKTHGYLAAVVRQMRGWRTITSVVRTPCVSYSSLAAALCVLQLSYVFQKTQTNRKENEHVENSLRQPCDLVFRTAVLRCCSQQSEAAVRNQD